MRESIKLSEVFSTVQQRKGDRFVKLFMASFFISMMVVIVCLFRISMLTPYNFRSRMTIWSIGNGSMQK